MMLRLLLLPALLALLLAGCGTSSGGQAGSGAAEAGRKLVNPALPAGQAPATVRTGDTLTVQLQSIPDAETFTVQVDDRGAINLRYVGLVQASGLTPSDLARSIERAYIDGQFYRAIDVSVALAERYIYVGGEVHKPGRVLWTPDLTLSSAISAAGGFSPYAKQNAVLLSRDEESYILDARLAARDPAEDRALLPGDRITVPKTAF